VVNGDIDATLLRFLRARKWHVDAAFAMLESESQDAVPAPALQRSSDSSRRCVDWRVAAVEGAVSRDRLLDQHLIRPRPLLFLVGMAGGVPGAVCANEQQQQQQQRASMPHSAPLMLVHPSWKSCSCFPQRQCMLRARLWPHCACISRQASHTCPATLLPCPLSLKCYLITNTPTPGHPYITALTPGQTAPSNGWIERPGRGPATPLCILPTCCNVLCCAVFRRDSGVACACGC
jgi:hypothetical protein